jgi:hypothetical protein
MVALPPAFQINPSLPLPMVCCDNHPGPNSAHKPSAFWAATALASSFYPIMRSHLQRCWLPAFLTWRLQHTAHTSGLVSQYALWWAGTPSQWAGTRFSLCSKMSVPSDVPVRFPNPPLTVFPFYVPVLWSCPVPILSSCPINLSCPCLGTRLIQRPVMSSHLVLSCHLSCHLSCPMSCHPVLSCHLSMSCHPLSMSPALI